MSVSQPQLAPVQGSPYGSLADRGPSAEGAGPLASASAEPSGPDEPRRGLPGLVRFMDCLVAAVALVFFGPLMALIALAIVVFDPGPVFFAHRRIGKNGKTFFCLKFRTMVVDAELRLAEHLARSEEARREWQQDHKLRDDPRITALGAFLRKSSLDELPQLFNVLTGEMSLVGPRPIVAAEAPRYGRYFVHYCNVRPGMTGLWQVSGRNDVSYRRRVAMDVAYCRAKSVPLDLWIMARTVPAVFAPRGSY